MYIEKDSDFTIHLSIQETSPAMFRSGHLSDVDQDTHLMVNGTSTRCVGQDTHEMVRVGHSPFGKRSGGLCLLTALSDWNFTTEFRRILSHIVSCIIDHNDAAQQRPSEGTLVSSSMAYMAKASLALLPIPPDLLKIKQEITLTKLATNVFSHILPLLLLGVDHQVYL